MVQKYLYEGETILLTDDVEIMLVVQPERLYEILNGSIKAIISKTILKDFKGWVNLYCADSKNYFMSETFSFGYTVADKKTLNEMIKLDKEEPNSMGNECREYNLDTIFNGKVMARFWYDWEEGTTIDIYNYGDVYMVDSNLLYDLGLTYQELEDYGKNKDLYAWLITQLEIFDKPKELKDFYVLRHELVDNDFLNPPYWCDVKHTLTKAPNSWQYVYSQEQE